MKSRATFVAAVLVLLVGFVVESGSAPAGQKEIEGVRPTVQAPSTEEAAVAEREDIASLERQFRTLPVESRRLTAPILWMHGDASRQRVELEIDKVAEGGNGAFLAWAGDSHYDEGGWPGETWRRDLAICLEAAKKHNLKIWILDDELWPSQTVGGKVPLRYAAKHLEASAVEVEGPRDWEGTGYGGDRYIAALAGRLTADSKIVGNSLVDLAPFIRDGRLTWKAPAGKWRIMKFTHVQAPGILDGAHARGPSVDGASKDCVDWFLQTLYQWYYDGFKADFGKTIVGFFYDEPETQGDWGTELNRVLAEWKVDWKKAYVAYKFELAGEEQTAARYQYLDAFAEAWGRTMFGGVAGWCHAHGVKSIGHFMEHGGEIAPKEPEAQEGDYYKNLRFCAGNMMRLQGYSDMGAIDAVFKQFVMGQRVAAFPPTWQTPKLASSISHVYGKSDDLTMVETFGARGQDLTYPEMKWWTDHFQVSGVDFMIPSAFNVAAPYATLFPPYFYNGGYEPRWPLYRVYADYTNRLSLMLTGGRHVCPVALLFMGHSAHVGRYIPPEYMSTALQDGQIDCDWMPYDVFENRSRVAGRELRLYKEQYRVLIVPPVEVIPLATLAKIKEFLEGGGVVVGYGILPSKSATLGHDAREIAALRGAVWGPSPAPGLGLCRKSAAGGRSYFLPAMPSIRDLQKVLAGAGVHPTLEVLAGETSGWLHVLHRVKAGRDVFLVCNQNHEGAARQFKFRATAAGEPENWDAMRNEVTAIPFQRVSKNVAELSLNLEPLETELIVFQPKRASRPQRIEGGGTPIREPILLARDPNPPAAPLPPVDKSVAAVKPPKAWRWSASSIDANSPMTVSPVAAADPFRGHFTIPADVYPATCRILLEMLGAPDDSVSVTVNGVYTGGVIGQPLRLDISRNVRLGENTVLIGPLAPKSVRLVFYSSARISP